MNWNGLRSIQRIQMYFGNYERMMQNMKDEVDKKLNYLSDYMNASKLPEFKSSTMVIYYNWGS